MNNLIQPKILKGFRDSLPNDEIERALLTEKLVKVFRNSGFVPIDTPALEYSEILLRKSGGDTEKQVFRFNDNGGRDVSMRFDLTVPLARFVAEHHSALYFPFKRYHIAKVWRGEKPQAGRYREFMQCDFDIIGSDTAAVDFEILSLIKKSLNELGDFGFKIHISHRGIFTRFLTVLGVEGESEEILRTVDKLSKIGKDGVLEILTDLVGGEKAKKILEFVSGAGENNSSEDFIKNLKLVENLAGGEDEDTKRIKEIYDLLCATGIQESFIFDSSITRGLDYYTGVVYETFLTEVPSIGSVCSGGRYDNLTGLYMKEKVVGVGASIGLDRLLSAFEELRQKKPCRSFITAIIFCMNNADQILAYKLSAFLASKNINVEVYPEAKKMNQQYSYAEKKGIMQGIFLNENSSLSDFEKDKENFKFRLKNLATREEEEVSLRECLEKLK